MSQVIKKFQRQQLKGLTSHLRLFGPLPTPSEAAASSSSSTEPSIVLPNPFVARKSPKTGKWRGHKYSLRCQADLVKRAKESGQLATIPPGPKLFALELRMKRLEAGLSKSDSPILAAAQMKLREIETKIPDRLEAEVAEAGQKLERAKGDEVSKAEEAQVRLWKNPFWVGDVKRKASSGEELGIKLYAGKKKMFKGHNWEKVRAKRLSRQKMLMRDMKARITRYKTYYKKRKPNPLKPSRLSKPPKLPF